MNVMDQIIEDVRRLMEVSEPHERVELLDKFKCGYCRFCGYPENTKERPGQCQCTNDE